MRLFGGMDVGFDEVIQSYEKDFGPNNNWEIENLKSADRKFGSWICGRIPSEDIGEIVLPFHNRGGMAITPETGTTLEDAFWNFKAKRPIFEIGNPRFCNNFEWHKADIIKNGMKAVYLSQEPLFTGPSYEKLTAYKGKITHLDGLHRLMAFMDLPDKPESLLCYLAAYLSFVPKS
jgi:hypothetical protein